MKREEVFSLIILWKPLTHSRKEMTKFQVPFQRQTSHFLLNVIPLSGPSMGWKRAVSSLPTRGPEKSITFAVHSCNFPLVRESYSGHEKGRFVNFSHNFAFLLKTRARFWKNPLLLTVPFPTCDDKQMYPLREPVLSVSSIASDQVPERVTLFVGPMIFVLVTCAYNKAHSWTYIGDRPYCLVTLPCGPGGFDEYGGSMFLWNVGIRLQIYTVSQPRRPQP
jgi:hypothetical protein